MFWKLVKHEFKSTYAVFVQMILGLFVMTVINMIMMFFIGNRNADNHVYGFIDGAFAFIVGLWILAIIAISVTTFILIVRRFYVTMVGRGAYVSYSLPVSATSLVGAKFFVSLVWKLVMNLAIFISVILVLITLFSTIPDFKMNMDRIREGIEVFNMTYPDEYASLVKLLLTIPVMSIFAEIYAILIWFLASVIGMQARKYRVGTMIVTVIGISFVMQIITTLLLVNDSINWLNAFGYGGNSFQSVYYMIDFQTGVLMKNGVVSLILSVICFVLTSVLVKKKPNIV